VKALELLSYHARPGVHKASAVVAPSKLLKSAAVETGDLLHVDGQHFETPFSLSLSLSHTLSLSLSLSVCFSLSLSLFSLSLSLSHTHTHRSGEATGKQAAKLHQLHQLLREHICAGVLSLGNKCTFVLEYDV